MIKFAKDFPIGSTVEVGMAYRMGGSFLCDGWEGTWFVLGHCGDKDLYLAREMGEKSDWEGIVHVSRIVGSGWHSDRPTPSARVA